MSEESRPHYASFAAIQGLRDEELRALLSGGDPAERIWAAWSLGLRAGPRVVEELAGRARSDPHPGVRRHLLVMLAGYGYLDLLCSVLREDPKGLVRATAACYLAVLVRPADDGVYELLAERLRHDSEVAVRAAIARQLRVDAPEPIWPVLEEAIADRALEVRRACFHTLAARERRRGEPRLPANLRERARLETDPELRRRLLDLWLEREGVDSLLQGLAGEPDATVVEALRVALRRDRRARWSAIAPLASRTDPEVMMRIGALLEGRLDTVPLDWLIELVLRAKQSEPWALAQPHSGRPERLWKGMVDGIAGRLVGRSRESLRPHERAAAHQLRQVAEAWVRAARQAERPEER